MGALVAIRPSALCEDAAGAISRPFSITVAYLSKTGSIAFARVLRYLQEADDFMEGAAGLLPQSFA